MNSTPYQPVPLAPDAATPVGENPPKGAAGIASAPYTRGHIGQARPLPHVVLLDRPREMLEHDAERHPTIRGKGAGTTLGLGAVPAPTPGEGRASVGGGPRLVAGEDGV